MNNPGPGIIDGTVNVVQVQLKKKKHYTSCVSTTGGPFDLNLNVAFPEPTALEASGESADVGPRLAVLGPMPSSERKKHHFNTKTLLWQYECSML